jgi:hypothetical protein
MKANPLFFVLIAGLFSCNAGVVQKQPAAISPPRDIKSQNIAATQVTLVWEAVKGATGYSVSYGKTADYGYTVETIEPVAVIAGLEKDTAYYFAVRTKDGKAVSSLPTPLVITTTGDANGSDPTVSGDEKEKKPETTAETKPFDSATFPAEKAAWEAQNLRDYRFVIRTFIGSPSSPATITVSSATETKIECREEPLLLFGETIDAMYAAIAAEIADTTDCVFKIRYHSTYHYPEYFSKSLDTTNLSDGGVISFEITSFEVLD